MGCYEDFESGWMVSAACSWGLGYARLVNWLLGCGKNGLVGFALSRCKPDGLKRLIISHLPEKNSSKCGLAANGEILFGIGCTELNLEYVDWPCMSANFLSWTLHTK